MFLNNNSGSLLMIILIKVKLANMLDKETDRNKKSFINKNKEENSR